MSLPKARIAGESTVSAVWNRCRGLSCVVLLCAGLAACGSNGFSPMYAASSDGSSLSNELRQVQITTIPGRVGQLVRNELSFQTTGGSGEARPKYRLDIALTERVTTTLVNEQGDSLSQVYSLDAAFKLTNMTGDKVFLEGTSFGRASFERVSSIFANVRAREGAEVRSAKTVANDIRSRLAAFLARG